MPRESLDRAIVHDVGLGRTRGALLIERREDHGSASALKRRGESGVVRGIGAAR